MDFRNFTKCLTFFFPKPPTQLNKVKSKRFVVKWIFETSHNFLFLEVLKKKIETIFAKLKKY